jgi:glucose-1-phosphate thymidylyltransferase
MIFHAIEKLVEAGVEKICVVTGYEHVGAFATLLGDGSDLKCNLTYRVQMKAGGIAQALGLADDFVGGDNMCVILGDNIFEDSLKKHVKWFDDLGTAEAMVMLKEVPDPGRFGVAEVKWVNNNPFVVGIEEKPKEPKSSFAVTGVYFYTSSVFEIIETLQPSGRGELEITDVNNEFVRNKIMTCRFWEGWWTDAGTHESYRLANELAWKTQK